MMNWIQHVYSFLWHTFYGLLGNVSAGNLLNGMLTLSKEYISIFHQTKSSVYHGYGSWFESGTDIRSDRHEIYIYVHVNWYVGRKRIQHTHKNRTFMDGDFYLTVRCVLKHMQFIETIIQKCCCYGFAGLCQHILKCIINERANCK